MKCGQCGKEATSNVIWRDTYNHWFCDAHAPDLGQLVKKNLSKEKLRFKKWLAEQLNS